jgi:transketolase
MYNTKDLQARAKVIRRWILRSVGNAGSGHVTSSFSSVEVMLSLFANHLKYYVDNSEYINNDRVIFSKGHASPLMYSLWALSGGLPPEELLSLRQFGSRLEGHPTRNFPFFEVATGSLGQGLSAGVGMAISAKMDDLDFKTYVLLGDGEMAEGQIWEAMMLASKYELKNLVGIIDVNKLGQSGETMFGDNLEEYRRKCEAFGWQTYLIYDGHNFGEIEKAFEFSKTQTKPLMIIASTIKGKGVFFLENKPQWHGKAVMGEDLVKALDEIGKVDESLRIDLATPTHMGKPNKSGCLDNSIQRIVDDISKEKKLSSRKVYGKTLIALERKFGNLVALDAEVRGSTFVEEFAQKVPQSFREMYIAEQNMLGVATGLLRRGKQVFVSTFAAFLTRAFDQIRMGQYSGVDLVVVGSHCGVSIGEDGPSQMGLEDMAMFATVFDSVILYPSDAISAVRLLELAYHNRGLTYVRMTRMELPILYTSKENFEVGGSKILKSSKEDRITLVGAGVTLHECLKASELLAKKNIQARVVDLYSVKPLDTKLLKKCLTETEKMIVVEDHCQIGGMGSAILESLSKYADQISHLSVTRQPRSGSPEELLKYEGIDAVSIVTKAIKLLK